MDIEALKNVAKSVMDAAGIVDVKSAVGGALLFKVAEPYLIRALITGLPKGVKWLIALAKSNPTARQILLDHRLEFEKMFDEVDAAVHEGLDKPEPPKA